MAKSYETQFKLTASEASSFKAAFSNANKALKQTQNQVKALRSDMKSLQSSFKEGKVTADEYAQAQEKIAKAYVQQRKAAAALKGVQKTQAIQDKVNSVHDKAGGVAMKTGAAAIATIGFPIKEAMDFEDAMADVRKVVDFDTPQQFKQMGLDIQEMSGRLPMAAKDIAAIVAAGGQAGIAKEDLAGFAESAVKMGVAFDITADEAGTMMAQWRTAFGMNQGQVVTLADQINYLSNTTAAGSGPISDIVTRIGPLASAAGLSAGQVAALGASIAGTGTPSEIAATGIKNMALALTAGSAATKSQAGAFAQLGLDATDVANRMQTDAQGAIIDVLERIKELPEAERAAMLTELFGKESVSAIAPLLTQLDNLKDNFHKVGDESLYAGSMQAEFDARMATTSNSLQVAKNAVSNLATTIGTALLPGLKTVTDGLAPAVQGLANFAGKHQYLTAVVVGGVGGLLATVAAVSGLIWVTTAVLSPILSARKAWQAYRAAQLASTAATNAHSLASVRNAVVTRASGVAAKGAAVGHWALNGAMTIGRGLMSAARVVAYFGALAAAGAASKAAAAGQWAMNAALTVGQGLMSAGKIVAYGAAMVAVRGMTAAWTAAQWLLNVALTANPIGLVIAGIAGLIAVGYLLISNWDTVKQWFITLWNDPKAAIDQFTSGAKALIGEAADWIMGKWEALKSFLSSPIQGVVNIAKHITGDGEGGEVTNENAKGGIYGKGAFTTWFAEESPEAAIPINGSNRSKSLWTKTGQMLGLLPKDPKPTGARTTAVARPPRMLMPTANQYHGNQAPVTVQLNVTLGAGATQEQAQDLAAIVRREVQKILDARERRRERVAYGN